MRRSDKKMLTTHVGSLPYLMELDKAASDYPAKLTQAVADVVEKQRSIGIDIMNEGEYAKGGDWLSISKTASAVSSPARPSPARSICWPKVGIARTSPSSINMRPTRGRCSTNQAG